MNKSKKIKFIFGLITTVSLTSPMMSFAESADNLGYKYCKAIGDGENEMCSALSGFSITMPTFWPTLTLRGASFLLGGLTKSLSQKEKQQLAMASVEASEVLTNIDTETGSVKGQLVSSNFKTAKATLESHLKELDQKEVGLAAEDLANLTDGQAALLMVTLSSDSNF